MVGRFGNNRPRQIYVPPPPPARISQSSSGSNLKNTMVQGMALGAGSAVGSMAVNGIANSLSSQEPKSNIQTMTYNESDIRLREFNKCMRNPGTLEENFEICKDLYSKYLSKDW